MANHLSSATGEVFKSYNVHTQNCDAYPLLNRFHKLEPDVAPDRKHKRTVVPLGFAEFHAWLMERTRMRSRWCVCDR